MRTSTSWRRDRSEKRSTASVSANLGTVYSVAPEIRSMVQYRPFNLLSDFGQLGNFDAVYCRNVLIYFDQQTKVDVLERVARITEADGFLVLGAAETVVGLTEAFKPIPERRGLYLPNKAALGTKTAPPRLAAVGGAR